MMESLDLVAGIGYDMPRHLCTFLLSIGNKQGKVAPFA